MIDEIYDVVNEAGEKLSTATWTEVHDKGLLHPSVSLFLFRDDSRNEILMQKRSDTMVQRPGAWQHSAGGHILAGESPDQGIIKEISEELFSGLQIPKNLKPRFLFRFVQNNDIPNNNELLHIYEAIYDGKLNPDPKEVSQLEWRNINDVANDLRTNPDKFTNSFIQIFNNYIKYRDNRSIS